MICSISFSNIKQLSQPYKKQHQHCFISRLTGCTELKGKLLYRKLKVLKILHWILLQPWYLEDVFYATCHTWQSCSHSSPTYIKLIDTASLKGVSILVTKAEGQWARVALVSIHCDGDLGPGAGRRQLIGGHPNLPLPTCNQGLTLLVTFINWYKYYMCKL